MDVCVNQESDAAPWARIAEGTVAETIVRYRRDFRGGVEARIAVERSDFSPSTQLAVSRAVL